MRKLSWIVAASALISGVSGAAQAAGGDLLVAPTRILLDGARGTEVILSNIGADTATYRISLQLRRMAPDGSIEEIDPATASERENKAVSMISYAPRKVVLAPNQPQAVRIGLRAPADLADGEYRVHMLFRAIPDAKPVTATGTSTQGLSIALTPIYGVTIPVIIRKGSLQATAGIANPKIEVIDGTKALSLSLTRKGTRSTYGAIRVLKPGQAKPVFETRGVAVYPEVEQRRVNLALTDEQAAALTGPATVQYIEDPEAGGRVMAEVKTVIN
jgi:P pilus assembly chaperone PapD